ncbi:MAG: hypothetical protein GY859_18445 [Desulfobacterales bacterium]|nr:hypothetical protein [Desulfobacterales bacterium]
MVESSFTIGVMKGEKAGVEKGEKIGMEKGEKTGVRKGAVEIAINLKSKGDMDAKTISEMTGLTEEEIEELKPE